MKQDMPNIQQNKAEMIWKCSGSPKVDNNPNLCFTIFAHRTRQMSTQLMSSNPLSASTLITLCNTPDQTPINQPSINLRQRKSSSKRYKKWRILRRDSMSCGSKIQILTSCIDYQDNQKDFCSINLESLYNFVATLFRDLPGADIFTSINFTISTYLRNHLMY